jgi:ADP-ribosylglycohydrolase
VAAHWSDPEWPEAVERITRVRQNNPRAVAYNTVHAMLLRELLRGRDLHSAFHWVQEALAGGSDAMLLEARRKLDDAFALKHKDVTEATQELGQSCPLICSFPAAAHAALRFPDDFTGCITAILKAGGDNAGRAAMAGAWLGARVGLDGLPDAWIARLKDRDDIAAHTETIVRRAGMPD